MTDPKRILAEQFDELMTRHAETVLQLGPASDEARETLSMALGAAPDGYLPGWRVRLNMRQPQAFVAHDGTRYFRVKDVMKALQMAGEDAPVTLHFVVERLPASNDAVAP